MLDIIKKISTELQINDFHAANAIKLMVDEECTIAFVARYRKELTGSMDEVKLIELRDRYGYLVELETTKARYLKVIEEQAKEKPEIAKSLPDLREKFAKCETKQQLEDLYLPFKPKRRTRAQIAKEKGLEPLLTEIMQNKATITNLEDIAKKYITPSGTEIDKKLEVPNAAAALAGAADILAETISETAEVRAQVRELSNQTGRITAALIEHTDKEKADKAAEKAPKYQNYFEYSEPVTTSTSHRIMAVFRGEKENVLRINIDVDQEKILNAMVSSYLNNEKCSQPVNEWIVKTIEDAYRRLISPSIETEIRMNLKKDAEEEAIKVFSTNLENLLLLPPIPDKVVMGVDPGLRTGSKIAIISETGKLLDHVTIYPTPGRNDSPKTVEAKSIVAALIKKYKVATIAIGNGTGSREIDEVIIAAMREHEIKNVQRAVVNEAGASVYSTEQIARDEFPDLDPTIRSAISIGRRLQDPLAELVKIEPRSIGVGQYQHDCNVTRLNKTLTETVESCVNRVGINANTASYKLLNYVSGIGMTLAKNIVAYRDKHGKFKSRDEIKKVTGFGPKAFEQSAGFLRIPDSENPLDNSSVHPERYELVKQITQDLSLDIKDLVGKRSIVDNIPWEKYVREDLGMPTLKDIAAELIKPGRDPREDGARLMFSDEVSSIEDLKPGMKLKGTVSNVTNFGAFVDIGVHQDGLIHISELSDTFIKDPAEAVAVGDVVDVRVMEVDVARKRISLSRKSDSAPTQQKSAGASVDRNQQQQRAPGAQAKGKNHQQQKSAAAKQDQKSFTANDLLAKFNMGSRQ